MPESYAQEPAEEYQHDAVSALLDYADYARRLEQHITELKEKKLKAKEQAAPLVQAAILAYARQAPMSYFQAFVQDLYWSSYGISRETIKTALRRLGWSHTGVMEFLRDGVQAETTCRRCHEPMMYTPTSFHALKQTTFEYCDPCRAEQAKENAGAKERWEAHKRHEAAEVARLRALPYADYLQTPHWQAVRKRALKRARFRCQVCAVTQTLHVHHNSYEHRGEELKYMEDVVVLCDECHKTHHQIGGVSC